MEILYKSQRSYHFAPSGVNEARVGTLAYVFTEVSALDTEPEGQSPLLNSSNK